MLRNLLINLNIHWYSSWLSQITRPPYFKRDISFITINPIKLKKEQTLNILIDLDESQ